MPHSWRAGRILFVAAATLSLLAILSLLPMYGWQQHFATAQAPAVSRLGSITPSSGPLKAGTNAIVWIGPDGQPSSPVLVANSLRPSLVALAANAIWMLSGGSWLYFLPPTPSVGTLATVPPIASLFVYLTPDPTSSPLLPDLVPQAPKELGLERREDGHLLLRFTMTVWNSGFGPLEMVGTPSLRDGKQLVNQRIYFKDGTIAERPAGLFIYHPEHQHIHLEAFARFVLRRPSAPDEAGRGVKLSSCVADFQRVSPLQPGSPAMPAYTDCERQVQGLSVGWADQYPAFLPGQEIDITGLADGTYELEVTADPDDVILESDENNNRASILIELSVTNPSVSLKPSPSR